jgi:hypothetical protein
MCSLGYCHDFLLSTAGVDGLELLEMFSLKAEKPPEI